MCLFSQVQYLQLLRLFPLILSLLIWQVRWQPLSRRAIVWSSMLHAVSHLPTWWIRWPYFGHHTILRWSIRGVIFHPLLTVAVSMFLLGRIKIVWVIQSQLSNPILCGLGSVSLWYRRRNMEYWPSISGRLQFFQLCSPIQQLKHLRGGGLISSS